MVKTKKTMTEEQLVGLVRNALLVAGYEMGQKGDHWPVINDTIHSIAKEWEDTRLQRNVDAEMKGHLYDQLAVMEEELPKCTEEDRAVLTPKVKELRDIFDSYFSMLDDKVVAPIRDEDVPLFVKRAKVIIATLGDEHV
jgi:hypothetical protein